jgi:tetratricopeptide (TPR) repeat protein
MLNFFPSCDFSQVPKVSRKRAQNYLLNNLGLTLLSVGKPKEAEELLVRKTEMQIDYEDWENASVGYNNLADLQFRTGELQVGLESAKKALEMAEKIRSDDNIGFSKGYLGWGLYLLGKTKEAEKEFRQADELYVKFAGYRIHSVWGVFYIDFLISTERIDEALELTRQNLEICERYNVINDISRCCRCLGAIERIRGNKKQAEEHLQNAIEIARKIGMTFLEIEVLIERGRLNLDMGEYEDAIGDAEQALKICGRTGFRFYEPGAEIVLAKAYLAQKDFEKAEKNAKSAYEKASGMKYRWAEGDAGHLLGEIYSAMGQKRQAGEWIKKAVKCRKEILDPKAKESEAILERLG